jgi:hypothetical protein
LFLSADAALQWTLRAVLTAIVLYLGYALWTLHVATP